MNSLVVDASVAAKWLPPLDREPLAPQARALLEKWHRRDTTLMAPDLIWTEIGNVFWKSVKRGRCSISDAKSAIELLHHLDLKTFAASSLIDQAFGIAVTYNRTVYDSIYVALAVASNTALITADEKLVNALALRLPVKWLGDQM
jgi:predicted nucleic acid-binding protein